MRRSDKITLFGLFGAAILSVILNIGVREWYAPDIRYEEGSYYISGTIAITSLKLMNYGHSDAEDIIINSSFNRPIVDISTDDQSINLSIVSGGKENNYVSCKIDRLVPGQDLYIFYAVNYEKITPAELNKHFISKITFKGGKGKTGKNPFLFIMAAFLTIMSLVTVVILIFFQVKEEYKAKIVLYDEVINNINEINEINHKAKLDNITQEINALQIDNYIKDIKADKIYKQKLKEYVLRSINLFDKKT